MRFRGRYGKLEQISHLTEGAATIVNNHIAKIAKAKSGEITEDGNKVAALEVRQMLTSKWRAPPLASDHHIKASR